MSHRVVTASEAEIKITSAAEIISATLNFWKIFISCNKLLEYFCNNFRQLPRAEVKLFQLDVDEG